jgi:hypothetical protein
LNEIQNAGTHPPAGDLRPLATGLRQFDEEHEGGAGGDYEDDCHVGQLAARQLQRESIHRFWLSITSMIPENRETARALKDSAVRPVLNRGGGVSRDLSPLSSR